MPQPEEKIPIPLTLTETSGTRITLNYGKVKDIKPSECGGSKVELLTLAETSSPMENDKSQHTIEIEGQHFPASIKTFLVQETPEQIQRQISQKLNEIRGPNP